MNELALYIQTTSRYIDMSPKQQWLRKNQTAIAYLEGYKGLARTNGDWEMEKEVAVKLKEYEVSK